MQTCGTDEPKWYIKLFMMTKILNASKVLQWHFVSNLFLKSHKGEGGRKPI